MAASDDPVRLRFLVLRCQAGDEEAFARLYAEFAARTRRYLVTLCGADADDVHQELWLRVYRSLARLEDAGAFRTWLFRSTRHQAIDFLRRQRRAETLFSEGPPEALEGVAEAGDPAEWAANAQEVEALLGALSPGHREVLLLRYLDDLSHAEIALVLGVPVGTVRSRLHYATRAARMIAGRADDNSRSTKRDP